MFAWRKGGRVNYYNIDWYPAGSNAFTCRKAIGGYVPPLVAGKRRKFVSVDPTLASEIRLAIKNKRNREYMAAKRAGERVN